MFFDESRCKRAAMRYYDNDFALFDAIGDANELAITGLIKLFDHRVNCMVMGGGYNHLGYMDYPTPLSFALSRQSVNLNIVKLLIELGADISNCYAIKIAEELKDNEIRRLFHLPLIEKYYVESIDANDLSTLDTKKVVLGAQLREAFHNKKNVDKIRTLVLEGAPVNFRLEYGLEIKLEADFVAQFFLLLEGDLGESVLIENACKVLSNRHDAYVLVSYVRTGLDIYKILYSKEANSEEVKLNSKFLQYLKDNASQCRANPEHKNGSLIIAAGLRDTPLVSEIIVTGETEEINGAHVNFKGYFDDNAATWSTILLDMKTLKLLLENHSDMYNLGITKSSLLHWVALAARLNNTPEKQSLALEITQMLLSYGLSPVRPNILGKTALDYARGELRELLVASAFPPRQVLEPASAPGLIAVPLMDVVEELREICSVI